MECTIKKKQVLLSFMLMLLSISMAQAQKAYTYVQQNDTKIDKLGTAAFDLSSSPSVEFVDGKAMMTIGTNAVAKLPMSDGGQLCVEFETTMADAELNKVTKTFTNPYATLYSPFQLEKTSGDVNVYVPNYDSSNTITLNEIAEVIPVETPLILQNAGEITFGISVKSSTAISSNFSGSSLIINKPDVASGQTLYTLGHEANDASRYGFFPYTGTMLGAGLCYLTTATVEGVRAFYFDGWNEDTGTSQIENGELKIENSSAPYYNLAGQRVNSNAKGIVISNGKKVYLQVNCSTP